MAVSRQRAQKIAQKIVKGLVDGKYIEVQNDKDELIKLIDEILYEELSAEQKLNNEVRRLLEKYEGEIEKGRLDYRSLFDMTKKKLAQERNIIL